MLSQWKIFLDKLGKQSDENNVEATILFSSLYPVSIRSGNPNSDDDVCYKQVAPPTVSRRPNSICQKIIRRSRTPSLDNTSYRAQYSPLPPPGPIDVQMRGSKSGTHLRLYTVLISALLYLKRWKETTWLVIVCSKHIFNMFSYIAGCLFKSPSHIDLGFDL